ncbi:hypothetical protein [Actinoplanes derwentensis]|uniref:hypothetical protein n=1 Tax=Actinoplanes derwentensis TaxID=113562 RepID=UPI0019454B25|nr:hypothetical protein [Actinoplanes derwentensis]
MRNSLLEQAHHDGLLTSGAIVSLTRSAVAPAGRPSPEPDQPHRPNQFTGLSDRYPRPWACLTAVADAFTDRRRHPLRLTAAAAPQLPGGADVAPASPVTTTTGGGPVFSAIDPRYDHHQLHDPPDRRLDPSRAPGQHRLLHRHCLYPRPYQHPP